MISTMCHLAAVLLAQAEPQEEAVESAPLVTADEFAAWLVTGLLVGWLAGAVYMRRAKGFGLLGNLGIGLVGAFLAGLLTNLLGMEFDWGQIVIGFDELVFALLGAVGALAGFGWLKSRAGARKAASQ